MGRAGVSSEAEFQTRACADFVYRILKRQHWWNRPKCQQGSKSRNCANSEIRFQKKRTDIEIGFTKTTKSRCLSVQGPKLRAAIFLFELIFSLGGDLEMIHLRHRPALVRVVLSVSLRQLKRRENSIRKPCQSRTVVSVESTPCKHTQMFRSFHSTFPETRLCWRRSFLGGGGGIELYPSQGRIQDLVVGRRPSRICPSTSDLGAACVSDFAVQIFGNHGCRTWSSHEVSYLVVIDEFFSSVEVDVVEAVSGRGEPAVPSAGPVPYHQLRLVRVVRREVAAFAVVALRTLERLGAVVLEVFRRVIAEGLTVVELHGGNVALVAVSRRQRFGRMSAVCCPFPSNVDVCALETATREGGGAHKHWYFPSCLDLSFSRISVAMRICTGRGHLSKCKSNS